jgi:hypothetical protein
MDVHTSEIHALDSMASLRSTIKGSVQKGRCIALDTRTSKDAQDLPDHDVTPNNALHHNKKTTGYL